MKPYQKVLLIIAVIIVIGTILFLFRDKLNNVWIAVSSIWSGGMILLAKLKKSFFSSNESSLEKLNERLDQLETVEKDLIDTLMKERAIYREKISELEKRESEIDERIESRKEELESYKDFETWEEEVWEELTEEEQKEIEREFYGKKVSIDMFAYDDM